MNALPSVLHPARPEKIQPDTLFALLPARPLLDEVLAEITPLPRDVLFLGQAEDGLPVLLDLHNPAAGPVLILGKKGSGKTDLLRLIAQSAISTKTPGQVQFAVLTHRNEEWQARLSDAPHCVGVFYCHEPGAGQILRSLDLWISRAGGGHQAVLLLIDELETVLAWDDSTLHHLRQILAHGPGRRVWPIATARPPRDACLQEWLSLFRSRINAREPSGFSVNKNGKQINFWIPALGF